VPGDRIHSGPALCRDSRPTADLDGATFDRLFAADVRAPYFLVSALSPKMADRGGGSIITIAGVAGKSGWLVAPFMARLSRAGVDDPSWTAEFNPSGVRVNAVASEPVLTGTAPDRIVAFLASSKASHVSGAVFVADGGRTAI
jgi:NAD(P)-dependent dehydrogenase (short-subunit alcohol dehydrogenase family)